MKSLLWTVLLFTLCSLTVGQILFYCLDTACKNGCNEKEIEECGDGRIIKNATKCGCCHICVKPLKKGDPCRPTEIANLPREECGESLICNKETRKCEPNIAKPCVKAAEELKSRGSGGEMAYGEPAPDCDLFGDYKPKRCKKGLMCHCVSKDGERIFGTSLDVNDESMHCNCSRAFIASPEKVKLGDHLRCLPNGNFSSLQCSDTQCYCIRPTGELDGRPLNKSAITSLKCFDAEQHGLSFPLTPCLKEYYNVTKTIKNRMDNGTVLLGLDKPNCDPDGSYSPKQCRGTECYCVRANGKKFEESPSIQRYSKDAKEMKCNCLREKELLKLYPRPTMLVRTFLDYKCAPNGNYLPLQCPTPSTCRCVNSEGFQTSPDVMSKDRKSLMCYKEEYEEFIKDVIA